MKRSLLVRLVRQTRRWPWLALLLERFRHWAAWLWFGFWRRIIPASWKFGPPKGFFSIYENLKSGAVAGRVVLDEQPAPNTTETSLRRVAPLGQHKPLHFPILWSHHREARLVGPTLLLMNDEKRVSIESAWGPIFAPDDPAYRQFRRPPAVRLAGNWTSVVSFWSRGFHHWLMDVLPRLALLEEFPGDTRVLVPDGLQRYQRETLAMLGLGERARETSEQHLVIENYFFTAPVAMTGGFSPYAVNFLRRALLDKRDREFATGQKIYIRRVNALRGILNDEEVAEFLAHAGWSIFDTEQLTMAQQIQLFANATHVCALHGAALTNLVWSAPGTRVLEIVPSTFLNGVYEGIAEAAQLNYSYLLCRADTEFRVRVDLNELRKALG